VNDTLSRRIAERLIAWRWGLLAVAVVAGAAAFLPARSLDFDRSIENMFAPGDPILVPYERLKRTFGGNEIVLAVYEDERLLAPDGRGIERLARVSAELKAVAGVKDVISLDQPLGRQIVDETNVLAAPLRHLLEGYTHSADGGVAAVVCILRPQAEGVVPRQQTIDRLREIAGTLPSGMIAGEPVLVTDGFRYVEEDGRRLGLWTMALVSLVILASFRSLRWVLVSVAVVQLALLLTQGLLGWSGLRLSMVSSMLAAIVTVVGVGPVVHVIVRFREARLDGIPAREALARTGGLLAAPIFWSIATTAGGFASLMVADVGPVRDFGLMMSVGAIAVLATVVLVVPGLALAGRFDPDPRRAWGEHILEDGLNRLATAARRRPAAFALLILLASAAAIAGTARLQVETDFTRNFRPNSPIVRSYDFVETRLGGAGMWDVVVPAPAPLDWDYLKRVRRLEERLRSEVAVPAPDGEPAPALTKVLSLADIVVAGSPIDLDLVPLAVLQNVALRRGLKEVETRMPVLMEILYGRDPDEPGRCYLRIMLRARERQPSDHKRAIIEQVQRISREEFPPAAHQPGAEATGFFVLLNQLIDSVLRDQWTTFGVATAAVGLMMLVALRGPLLALISLVPNSVPILVLMGLMGWAGVKVNMGAAMIAAVSIGLSIDSSIHYITSFRRARDAGLSLDESLRAVHQGAGRAMCFSVVALIAGFASLATSPFVPTIYFGTLVSLSMLGGLAGNLVVLPVLLRLVGRR
jgi:predicted RND superfamily exporter protein